jgi:hypothetical protein
VLASFEAGRDSVLSLFLEYQVEGGKPDTFWKFISGLECGRCGKLARFWGLTGVSRFQRREAGRLAGKRLPPLKGLEFVEASLYPEHANDQDRPMSVASNEARTGRRLRRFFLDPPYLAKCGELGWGTPARLLRGLLPFKFAAFYQRGGVLGEDPVPNHQVIDSSFVAR